MREISDDELVSILQEEIANSLHGTPDTDDRVREPLDYYFGKLPVLTCTNRDAADIVSLDVHDAIESSVAEIMPAFAGSHIVAFEAESEQDEDQAKMESDVCNYLLMEQYNGTEILTTALKDCLLHRNAYARVYWDTRNEVSFESYDDIPDHAISQVMQPKSKHESVAVIEHEEVDPPEQAVQLFQQQTAQYEAAVSRAQAEQAAYEQHEAIKQVRAGQDGQTLGELAGNVMPGQLPQPNIPPQPNMPAFFNITLRRTAVKSNPVIDSIAPENAVVSDDHQCTELSGRFNAVREFMTKSALIQLGYPESVVMDLPEYTASVYYRDDDLSESGHESMALVEVFICYYRIDRDMDGIAELRRIVMASSVLLDDDPWDMTDIVAGTGVVLPHRHEGVSQFEVQKGVQDGKTRLIRSMIDGAARAANPRLEVDTSSANLKDLLESTTGVVRSKRIGSVAALPNPEVPPSVNVTLQYLDKMRRERGGSAVDSSSQTTEIGGTSAHGIERVMSSIELTNAMVARTFGETFVRGIYLRLHALLRKYSAGQISAKIDGKWITTKPSEWPQRERVSMEIGNSQGERQRLAGAIQQIQGMQMQMMQSQVPITSPAKLYESSVDAGHMMGVSNPEQYFIDPNAPEGQQLAQQAQQAKQMQMQMQQEDRQFNQQLAQSQAQSQDKIAQAEMAKAQVSAQNNALKHQIDQLNQQLEQAKAGADVALEQEKMDRDTSMKLLELEQEQNKQLNAEYEANKHAA